MMKFLPAPLRGVIASLLLGANTLLCAAAILPSALLKLLIPFKPVRKQVDRWLNWLAESWIVLNGVWIRLMQQGQQWQIDGLERLRYQGWYLVNSNHQSWVDIFVLQKVLNRRIPFLKFFLKRELIFVPVIGLAWWALDFPFMRRYSESYLKKHPERRGQDQRTTRAACEKFKLVPTSVINFLEGTRFTPIKHRAQQSPYRHLLRPKAGGIALALNAMGERFQSLLDVTIFYPDGVPSFWEFLCGKVRRVVVHIHEAPIPRHLINGDYGGDPAFRAQVQNWVHELWLAKDQRLEGLRRQFGLPAVTQPEAAMA
ncbi:acyltransferase [Chitinimonas lacunae]|uniref:Acyltransferase n=1 Tax=Chitinimonas lacunae TaxID=1963018 RepID=A0ABV8MU22_9NEIS